MRELSTVRNLFPGLILGLAGRLHLVGGPRETDYGISAMTRWLMRLATAIVAIAALYSMHPGDGPVRAVGIRS